MKRVAFIDLDGVIADNSERFKRAASRKDWHKANFYEVLKPELESPVNAAYVKKSFDDLLETFYWQRAFAPDLVFLDTLIGGAVEAISFIERYPSDREGYDVMYLTSRPESMRDATYNWLYAHELSGPDLIMKAPAFQFTKTTIWKVGMVQTLASLYDANEILFVDDEETNCEALRKATSLEGLLHLWCYHSLQETVEALKEETNE